MIDNGSTYIIKSFFVFESGAKNALFKVKILGSMLQMSKTS
jgi:hypothetical protein